MEDNTLKKKTVNGLLWNLAEKFSCQLVTFVVGVILARLLSPADYGLIAMTSIFVGISQVLVDSGFSSALIQKIDRTDLDYSTAFVVNIFLSGVICALLCIFSPFISDFYEEPVLKWIICFCGFKIFLSSFVTVQATRLSANLEFRTKSRIAIINSLISAVVAICMAYSGYGAWSLVVPEAFTIVSSAVMYWHFQHWFPGIRFSKGSFGKLFAFGSRLLVSSLLEIIYNNLYTIVIGKKFKTSQLGLYSKAQSFAYLPIGVLYGVISNVTYPTLSTLQNNKERLTDAYRKMIRLAAFIVFPLMVGIAILAKPLVVVLLTEKWKDATIYLQILCFSFMWYPIHILNLNLLKVLGRSDLVLRLEMVKKVLGVFILIVSIPFGLLWMCVGQILYSVISLFINTYYTGQFINIGFFKQLVDFVPSLIYSFAMGVAIVILMMHIHSLLLQLLLGIVCGILVYWLLSYLFHSKDLEYLMSTVKERFH